LIVAITNNGASAKCFVRANGISYRSSDSTVATASLAHVAGSVGETASGTLTGTCLDSGETGYLIDIQAPDATTDQFWTVVESAVMGSLSTSDTEVADPGSELIPTGYSVTGTSLQTLEVTGENRDGARAEGLLTSVTACGHIVELLGAPVTVSLAARQNGTWGDRWDFVLDATGSHGKAVVLVDLDRTLRPPSDEGEAMISIVQTFPSGYTAHRSGMLCPSRR
jgi:hypothetical protein